MEFRSRIYAWQLRTSWTKQSKRVNKVERMRPISIFGNFMARKDQAASLLTKGNSPGRIASLMGISIGSVEQYLYTNVGEGEIRRSDIHFSFDPGIRNAIENIVQRIGHKDCYSVFRAAKRDGHSIDYKELEIYLKLRDSRISLGDMYEFICQIETTLHRMIKLTLIDRYGEGEN